MEKKVVFNGNEEGIVRCPTCGATFYKEDEKSGWGRERCGHCGQRLDWSETQEKK